MPVERTIVESVATLRDAAHVVRSWCKAIRRADPKADTSNLNFLDDRAIHYDAVAKSLTTAASGQLPVYRRPIRDGLWWVYDADGKPSAVVVQGHWAYFVDDGLCTTPVRLGLTIGQFTRWVEIVPQMVAPEFLEVRDFCGRFVASYGLYEVEDECPIRAAHRVIVEELKSYQHHAN